jgi:hypothetical protein
VSTATLFPFSDTPAVELGEGLWQKQILPFGKIQLPGGKVLDVDENYLQPVMAAFEAGAFDQISLQMADGDNKHTDDPERQRGEVSGLQMKGDGLYATIRTTDAGTSVVKNNPKLGVSVRLLDDYVDHTGRHFKRALHHVLATLSPRVQGMKPWQLVKEFSDPAAAETVDLSDWPSSPVSGDGDEDGGDMTTITEEELAAAAAAEDEAAAAELGRLVRDFEATELTDTGGGSETVLAEVRQSRLELAEMRRLYNAERVGREIDAFALAGVPPALLQLARPVLEYDSVLELSDGTRISAAEQVRKMLNECKGYVELGLRTGSGTSSSPEQTEDSILAAWAAESDNWVKEK